MDVVNDQNRNYYEMITELRTKWKPACIREIRREELIARRGISQSDGTYNHLTYF